MLPSALSPHLIMYPVLDKVPASTLDLAEWIGRLAGLNLCPPANPFPLLAHFLLDARTFVFSIADLDTLGRPLRYPAVDTVAPYFGYLCLPAELTTNVALCIDGKAYREVGLSSLIFDLFDWTFSAWFIIFFSLLLAMVGLELSRRQVRRLTM